MKLIQRVLQSVLMLVMVAAGAIAVVGSNAAPAEAATWHCGATCTGKSPLTRLSNGVRCYDDRQHFVTVKPGPDSRLTGVTASDPYLIVRGYRSPKCNTIWVTLENTKATGRTSCWVVGRSVTAPTKGIESNACDVAGGAPTTHAMVDNYSASGHAARIFLEIGWAGGKWAVAEVSLMTKGSATDASPCGATFSSHGTTVQRCNLWRTASVLEWEQCGPYCSLSVSQGTVLSGSGNWFVCQVYYPTEPRAIGANWSSWWAYTLSDQGEWGFVNQVSFSGGGNNQPDSRLRRCTAADDRFMAAHFTD